MRLLLLGTAAAEGWPAPFCACRACEEARRRGGPNIRTRSGALIDDDLKIDYGPDTLMQLQRSNRHLVGLRTILFTHQHLDHIVPSELTWCLDGFTNTPPARPIHVYGNAQVIEMLRGYGEGEHPPFTLHELRPLEAVTTNTGDTVLPLPARHVEGALVLRITRGDKTIFYGHDTGELFPETIDALCDGTPLDIALFDCTNGGRMGCGGSHMSADLVVQTVKELRARGAVTDTTRVIATHFSHNGGWLHEELQEYFLPHRIAVAYDGMLIRV